MTRKIEELNETPVRGLDELEAIAAGAHKGRLNVDPTEAPAAAEPDAPTDALQDDPPPSLAQEPTPEPQEAVAASEDPLEAMRGMLSWFDTMNPPETGAVKDFCGNEYRLRYCIPAMSQSVVSKSLDRMFNHFKSEALMPMIEAFSGDAQDGNMAGMFTGFVALLTDNETIIAVGQCFDDSHPGAVRKMRKNYERRRAALVAIEASEEIEDAPAHQVEGPGLEWLPELNDDLPISVQVCELQEVVAGILPFAWRMVSSSGQTAYRMIS